MIQKLTLLLFLVSSILQSQNSISGKMEPVNESYNYVILYQLKGAKQLYIANSKVIDGSFKMSFPENASKGMYRLTYDVNNNGFVDFLYNNESISLKFDPTVAFETLEFDNSEENKIYTNYLNKTNAIRRTLDSLQLSFFNTKDEIEKSKTGEFYVKSYENYLSSQQMFEQQAKGKIAYHFIKSSNKYYASTLINKPQEYLNSEREHFFDFIDFNDSVLLNSIFYIEKITDYVFYLNSSDDIEMQNKLYMNSTNEILNKVNDNDALKAEILTSLMFNFAQLQNTVVLDYTIENLYKKLPVEFQKQADLNEIESKVRLAIGKSAPDFSFVFNGKNMNLSQLENASTYILVFWSTSCSHCLIEVPELYEFTKDKDKIHVVAVALENDELGFKQHTQKFEKWTNVLGLEKWQNKIAKDYEIVATPTYFILNAAKKIISKPYHIEDVKAFYGN